VEGVVGLIGGRMCQEVGAGSGWLSYWLRRYGVEIPHISDTNEWKHAKPETKAPVDIVFMPGVEAVSSVRAEVVILSWPPYMESLALDVWNTLEEGQYLLYIGESRGGCTGEFPRPEVHVDAKTFSSFQGIRDWATLYRKGDV
jgi:hypothetical protein